MSHDPEQEHNPNDCVIPHAAEPEALGRYLLKQSPFDGADFIREYVQEQSPTDRVTYAEKVATERVLGRDYSTWDVHTTGERYWVVTNPANLYPQRLFPSADYTLTFHIGLMSRVLSRREAGVDEEQRDRLASTWRRWMQAAEALDRAHEAEDFQAVGMRCRECLLSLVRDIGIDQFLPPEIDAPKAGDFIHWSEIVAGAIAGGRSLKEVRCYLRDTAKGTWQLVSWLTHAGHAVRLDGEVALQATQNVIASFGAALARFESGVPDRCPMCASYQITVHYVPELTDTKPTAALCQSCGWSNARVDKLDPE